jgi:hypothetical protein
MKGYERYEKNERTACDPEASSWRVVSVMKSCFPDELQVGSDAFGQTLLGSKSTPEILVMFTITGHVKLEGINPVLNRSSRVASILDDISMLQFCAPWTVTHVLHKPVHEEGPRHWKFSICSRL